MIKKAVVVVLLVLGGWGTASAQSAYEQEQIRLMLIQLQNMETIAAQMERNSKVLDTDRYRFDYDRLNKDLATVRAGLEHYLSPARAQPREVADAVVTGSYQKEKVKGTNRGND